MWSERILRGHEFAEFKLILAAFMQMGIRGMIDSTPNPNTSNGLEE
jgi:hypothetical protein